ncbi:hypothetical protein A2715_01675 [Candidatus Woesebacteria bacterium RIFCSPHIGHO2_01_FULL_39_32]|uniref:General secretion pathway protein G n=2 Tax=Candidatus Woeseibacteriota TaxID=1752722 RepID=A0A0G0PRE5_9BACT|nr:MAG: hypothetical protein UT61_C0003G0037 [Candidatus Woesebacteria bacterium GW2011_GWA1_39_8]OGM03842.1 MAG: hypothetical protein A2124_02535 [Candidatus Woesebacteria bacterium GWB1_37_5]OGM23868.1 MAG: hypothetical protein A2715_01675 [Candidatus Woesebacteria bacterium RIFCSPHIGHO2_01_FULL_39_32]OGM38667.1 MAG: hypothetical protein A3F01_02850 [Candidatus Woesebacteria bacterium RIFCSPHIGHO2_12_FULL_38_11]OGM64057.1 MAG: hypothetical protein A2893_02915 [Candidatus Woesebacteria bacteri
MIKENLRLSSPPNTNHQTLITKLGFTLIELLIVIAVLGGLAAIFMTSYPGAQKKARDSIRRSDIKQYQTAMEVYANKNNGQYFTVAATNIVTQCGSAPRPLVLPSCPDDPKSPAHYRMASSTLQYVLWGQLEILDDTVSPAQIQYFVVCSTGESGLKRGPDSWGTNCPI